MSHDNHQHDTDTKVIFGFWIYIMSDCILFASLFATYAVLHNNVYGGVTAKDIFKLPYVLIETFILLTSSFTYGLAMLNLQQRRKIYTFVWLIITWVLGVAFIYMELHEFHQLITEGHTPQKSAFLSAFFTLVGTHGLHVTCGLIWMIVLIIQLSIHGFNPITARKLQCLSLFWHFLDIVWIFVFSIVYLLGFVI